MTAWVLTAIVASAAIFAVLIVIGRARWRVAGNVVYARLDAGRALSLADPAQPASLRGLPAPVARYLGQVLADGAPRVQALRMRQSGTFNGSGGAGRWVQFVATQRVVTRRLGFVWDARIRSGPALWIHVRDALVEGEGLLQAALFGAIPVADLRGSSELTQGELMRFLAEAAWYPTALLPGQGVRWSGIDERSARATLSDGATTVSLDFHFDDHGLLERVHSGGRYRSVGSEQRLTPWQGKFRAYGVRTGMRVPIEAEVAWIVDGELRPYWRGRIESIDYEFSG